MAQCERDCRTRFFTPCASIASRLCGWPRCDWVPEGRGPWLWLLEWLWSVSARTDVLEAK